MATFKEKFKSSIPLNLLLIFLTGVLMYVVFFFSLDIITNHGEEVSMPSLLGKSASAAIKQLEDSGFEVDIDSAYDLQKKPLLILSQLPDSGSSIKKGRTIYLVVNKAEAPLTPMPALIGLSYKSALMVLKSNKLIIGDTTYVPDIAKGAILKQLYLGGEIKPGAFIPQGSRIDLVLGDGLSNVEFNVPNVKGMTYIEAVAVLSASGLQFIDLWEPPITDSAMAIVYYQSPSSRNEFGEINRIQEGDFIDIRIRQSMPDGYGFGDDEPSQQDTNMNSQRNSQRMPPRDSNPQQTDRASRSELPKPKIPPPPRRGELPPPPPNPFNKKREGNNNNQERAVNKKDTAGGTKQTR